MSKSKKKAAAAVVVEEVETRADPTYSISDPAFAEYLLTTFGVDVADVTPDGAMGVTAYWRAVSLIAGSIASLPLKAYRDTPQGRVEVASLLDNPAGPYPLTRHEWTELVMVHLLTRGNAYLVHIYSQSGALIGLWPVYPANVRVEWDGVGKKFTLPNGDLYYSPGHPAATSENTLTHVMGVSLDGLVGMSPLTVFRKSLQTSKAQDNAAYALASKGLLRAGIVTPDDDITEEEAQAIKDGLSAKIGGSDNAGAIAVVNRHLTFSEWSLSPEDAQFLQNRQFSVEEVARIFGLPPHLLSSTEKASSWGTGIAEMNLAFARYTLQPWTHRIEQSLTRLLPGRRFAEFDFAGLLKGTTKDEVELLIKQMESGLITRDEARAIRNLPPINERAA